MQAEIFIKHVTTILAALGLALAGWLSAFGQSRCLDKSEVKKMLDQFGQQSSTPLNKKLRDRLIKLKQTDEKRLQAAVDENKSVDTMAKNANATREKASNELCEILKTSGWPSVSLVGRDGLEALFYVLRHSESFDL